MTKIAENDQNKKNLLKKEPQNGPNSFLGLFPYKPYKPIKPKRRYVPGRYISPLGF